MIAGFNLLDRSEKIRIGIFTIITVIVTVFATLYVWEWCGLFEEPLISTGDGDIIIGLFRAFAFRKTNLAGEAEYLFAKWVLAVILAVGIVISLLLARFRFLIFITLLIFPIWLFGYLFYILPLKHKKEK